MRGQDRWSRDGNAVGADVVAARRRPGVGRGRAGLWPWLGIGASCSAARARARRCRRPRSRVAGGAPPAGWLRGCRGLAGGGLGPGQRQPAPRGRRTGPGPVPGLRLQRRVGPCRDPARPGDGLSGQLQILVPAARRLARQRPAVQADRRERRQRVVGEPAALRVPAQLDAGAVPAPAHRQGLGARSRPGPARQQQARIHRVQQRRRAR